MLPLRIAPLVVILTASPLFADWTYEVTGGKNDLKNVIVNLLLKVADGKVPEPLVVTDTSGKSYLAQMMPEGGPGQFAGQATVLVLVPELKAGQFVTLQVTPAAKSQPSAFRWGVEDNHPTDLEWIGGGQSHRLLSYVHVKFDPQTTPAGKTAIANPTTKPYHHVYDPATGKAQLTNGPQGQYPHHRGVYFGFNRISYSGKTADVWHCPKGEHQAPDNTLTLTTGPLFALHRFSVAWNGQDGKTFAEETRQLAVFHFASGTLIEFASRLRTDLAGGVKLDGDPQHAGFHFRANSSMEKNTKETYFLRPDGKGELGKEINWDPKTNKGPVNLPWDAMSYVLDGKRYTVLYLDHPDNPKEARQSERCYGRIGTYFEYELTPKKPLVVHYRLFIDVGELTAEECEAWSKAFTDPVKVVLK